MTKVAKVRKGDKFVCLHPRMAAPTVGSVIALTSDPGKMIGLEFENQVGVHSCDGRGKDKHCIWVHPDNILTEDEYAELLKVREAVQTAATVDLEELDLRK